MKVWTTSASKTMGIHSIPDPYSLKKFPLDSMILRIQCALKSSASPISPSLGIRVPPLPARKLGSCSSFPVPGFGFSLGLKRGNGEIRPRNCRSSREPRDAQIPQSSAEEQPPGFSMLSTDLPWDSGRTWSIMGGYFFCFHIPLSFGGLPTISQISNQPTLDPQSKTAALILLQTLELVAALTLLNYSRSEKCDISSFFQDHRQKGRSWVKAAGLGLGFLISVVLLTSLLADRWVGSKEVNNQELKEILENRPESGVGFFVIYCMVTPVLEEAIYRGFLLTSLAKKMDWRRAVAISAVVFSVAHLSPENFAQLFVIGCVLGSAYCWSGNLAASFAVHSLYNAVILFFVNSK